MGESVRGTADPRGGPGQVFLEVFLYPTLVGNLSFRKKCWKCSSKKGQAVEVVLGVPDPVADERSESEGSESDREEHTADRIAEKLGLAQFLRRRNKKRGGRGRDRGHSKSEAAPKRGSGGGRGGGAGGAAGLVAGVSGGPGPRTPSALMLPPQLCQVPQLPAVRPPLAGRSSAGRRRDARARGSSVLRGLAEVIAYTWATTRVVRNRLMRILTGNGPSSVVYPEPCSGCPGVLGCPQARAPGSSWMKP